MNLPNKLSILRIILVPIMMFFYLATFLDPWGKIVAGVIFIIAAITDRLDGQIARKTGQITDLGKLLDPIADRLLYNCGLLLVVADGTIPVPYGIIGLAILLFRDFIIDGIRQVAASRGIVVAAAWSGKIKAILHYTHIPMFIFLAGTKFFSGEFWAIFNQVLFIIALVVFVAATIVTIWSIIDYYVRNKEVFVENKVEPKEDKKTGTDEEKWKQIL